MACVSIRNFRFILQNIYIPLTPHSPMDTKEAISVVSKDQALWEKVAESARAEIVNAENNLTINKAILELAEHKLTLEDL